MTFGPEGKVARLEILWRRLKRDAAYRTATAEEFMEWIRNGKAVLDDAGMEDFDWSSARKITVNHVTPYYYGREHDVVQDWAYPFAMLEATVETRTTNQTVYLCCPIIDESKTGK